MNVSNDTDEEVLVVEAIVANSKVRFINAYGPQEDDKDEVKEAFYSRLDQEL